jgi:hypothetical protein
LVSTARRKCHDVVHGPRDFKHFNRKGMEALGQAVAGRLDRPLAPDACWTRQAHWARSPSNDEKRIVFLNSTIMPSCIGRGYMHSLVRGYVDLMTGVYPWFDSVKSR